MTRPAISIGLALVFVLCGSTSAERMLIRPVASSTAGRPSKAVGQSQTARLRPLQVSFDRQTRLVKMTVAVEDPRGDFIRTLRPENFAVFEDGRLQERISVEIEHAPVSLAVLVEGGGRYREIANVVNIEVPSIANVLRETVIPGDRIAVFSYANAVSTLVDFDDSGDPLDVLFSQFRVPGFSESNLLDSLSDVLGRMRTVHGRKALLLISSGIDSFSHASVDDAIAAARRSDTPVYTIGLAGIVRETAVNGPGPLSKLDWRRASTQLETLARMTGGRSYPRDAYLNAEAIFDDLMEYLRVRYVITYSASSPGAQTSIRSVRVTLLSSGSAHKSLRMTDAAGRPLATRVSVEASYSPR